MARISEIRTQKGLTTLIFSDGSKVNLRTKEYKQLPCSADEDICLEEYLERIAALQSAQAYEAALTLLDYSARSEKKLCETLLRKGFAAPACDAAVQRLKEAHLLDDAALAQRLAESYTHSAIGIQAAKRKLRAKGIGEEEAADALGCFDDAQQLQAAILQAKKLWRKYESLPLYKGKRKLSAALMRKGFSWDIIHDALENLLQDADED